MWNNSARQLRIRRTLVVLASPLAVLWCASVAPGGELAEPPGERIPPASKTVSKPGLDSPEPVRSDGDSTLPRLFVKLPSPPTRRTDAAEKSELCLECHEEVAALIEQDKHIADDFHCVVCHGESIGHLEMKQEGALPDRTWRRWREAENRYEWRVKNASLEIARFCASCHSQESSQRRPNKTIRWEFYLHSAHGRAVHDGNPDAPTCTDCHYAHGAGTEPRTNSRIVEACAICHADKEMMKRSKLDPNVVGDFKSNRHANMKTAAAKNKTSCISCHHPHH